MTMLELVEVVTAQCEEKNHCTIVKGTSPEANPDVLNYGF